MITLGICQSCGELHALITQTNFGATRRMCRACAAATAQCERAVQLRKLGLPSTGQQAAPRKSAGDPPGKVEVFPSNWLELYVSGKWDGES